MSIQFLLVTYPEQRAVLADGMGVGFTNHMLMLPADEYLITLGGDGYQPAGQDVVLSGTSQIKPLVVPFTPTGPVAVTLLPSAAGVFAARSVTAGAASVTKPASRAKKKNA